MVPYWIVPVSARTSIRGHQHDEQTAQTATTAALMGIVLAGWQEAGAEAEVGSARAVCGRRSLPPIQPEPGGTSRLGMFMGGFGMMGGGGDQEDSGAGQQLQLPGRRAEGPYRIPAEGLRVQPRRDGPSSTSRRYRRASRSSTATSARKTPRTRRRRTSTRSSRRRPTTSIT